MACGGLEGSDSTQEEPVATVSQALTGTWTALTNAPPANLDTCLLLTDGSVMCHQYSSNLWHRLRPDAFGSYQNGTWDAPAIPAMPNGNDPSFGCVNCTYAPLYFASAVLPDGRAVVIGGEYNNGSQVWTNIGFMYDPVANTWSNQLQDVFGGGNIGDAQGKVLQDGTFVVTNISTANMEALNPWTGVFTARNPVGKLDVNDEENWSLLYDGTVFTVDSRIVSSFERYTPSSNTWGNSGATPVNMADTGGLPVGNSEEVGPCMQRPDNKLMCFSGNALGQNALYDPSTNSWSHTAAMDFPAAPGGGHFAMADGAAAALPNGNILVMASPVTSASPFNAPSHFYEMDLATNTLSPVTDSPHAASFAAYQGRMVTLPTGEVLLTAFNQVQDVMLYSNGAGPAASSRPVITSAPATIAAGGVYTISGKLFNGFSEGAAYGDDAQSASNYPLVRITSTATGHVYYARTFNHSRMGVEPTGSATIVTTSFQVPTNFENGPATLSVVTNGIASQPVSVSSKFTSLTLQNGWTNAPFNTEVAAVANVGGIVQLKGAIMTSGTNASPFTLPVGFRPSTIVYVPADLFVANVGRLIISPDGVVTVQDEGGGIVNASQFTSLEGVSFATDATGFAALALGNGWTNTPFSTRNAAVKNDNGIIRFEGAIATSSSNSNAVPFTLPIGFRPPTDTYVPVDMCTAHSGRLLIQASGVVTVQGENLDLTQAKCFTSLEGATFALSSSGFTPVTLQNSWVNAPFATRNLAIKNDGGTVRFQGAVSSGTTNPIFTLPPELRPAKFEYVNVDLCDARKGRIYALPDGTVSVQAKGPLSDAQCFTSLEGVAFSFGI